ncbi:MAG: NAD-dependent epimerase/dehydratase family protein [Isosphaeraceae bacterium]|nr:NAD-dependent epimerase/dehydratase family protein [Isosphaeraceae bacterium]
MTSPVPALPAGSTVLVTGAGGFVGGHVVRAVAQAGYRVRGLVRRPPAQVPGGATVDWVIGDLRDPDVQARAVQSVGGVIHVGGWVSLRSDRRGESRAINVEATRALLERSRTAGASVFLYTSTLWTVAAGTAERPADEDTPWNLDSVRSPYCDTKREAEALTLATNGPGFRTAVLCPGLVIGAGDRRPTSTGLLLTMARWPVVWLPEGGTPVVDVQVVADAHVRALTCAEPGRRYVVAGPYLSYRDLAVLVARVAHRPWHVLTIPDALERPLARVVEWIDGWGFGLLGERTAAAVGGGFLCLHISGARADAAFGLRHPDPLGSIHEALSYARQIGLAPWLRLRSLDEAAAVPREPERAR